MNSSESTKPSRRSSGSIVLAVVLSLTVGPHLVRLWAHWRKTVEEERHHAVMEWLGFEHDYTSRSADKVSAEVGAEIRTIQRLRQGREDRALERLDLSYPSITDSDLKHLKDMRTLEVLSLYGTDVTDDGLEHLRGLTNLKKLSLHRTRVTRTGVNKLREALPDCEIKY